MLTTSHSPRLNVSTIPRSHSAGFLNYPSRHDNRSKSLINSSPIVKAYPTHVYSTQPERGPSQCLPTDDQRSTSTSIPIQKDRPKMVDAATQYSPPSSFRPPNKPLKTSASQSDIQPHLAEKDHTQSSSLSSTHVTTMPPGPVGVAHAVDDRKKADVSPQGSKRQAVDTHQNSRSEEDGVSHALRATGDEHASSKRARAEGPPARIMPIQYEKCDTRDLVILISSMLMELIRYNDEIPLQDGHLTRFHSRAPPGISVIDYLQRLATHATLSPPILLSMVYYIDKLCALYPAFTISSLTVHRFLITSATVASKGLSDSFWTNKTYARVGGVSLKELALLELEFLVRVQWRIVPRPEVLVDYYTSLVERSPGYELEAVVEQELDVG